MLLATSTGALIIGAVLILIFVVPMVLYGIGLLFGGIDWLFGRLPGPKRSREAYERKRMQERGIIDGAEIVRQGQEAEREKLPTQD